MTPDPRELALEAIDRRYAALRLPSPLELRRLRRSVERKGLRHPVLVSSAVAAERWVLLDGFKRVRVAEELGLARVWARVVAFDAAQSKAAIVARVLAEAEARYPGLVVLAETVSERPGAGALAAWCALTVRWSGWFGLRFPSRLWCTRIEHFDPDDRRGSRARAAASRRRCPIRTRSPPGASSRSRR